MKIAVGKTHMIFDAETTKDKTTLGELKKQLTTRKYSFGSLSVQNKTVSLTLPITPPKEKGFSFVLAAEE